MKLQEVSVKVLRDIECPDLGFLRKNQKLWISVPRAEYLLRRKAAELLTPLPVAEPDVPVKLVAKVVRRGRIDPPKKIGRKAEETEDKGGDG